MRTALLNPTMKASPGFDHGEDFDLQVEEAFLNGLAKRAPPLRGSTPILEIPSDAVSLLPSEKQDLEAEREAIQEAAAGQQSELLGMLHRLRDQCQREGQRIIDLTEVFEEKREDATWQMQEASEGMNFLEEELRQVLLEREALLEAQQREETEAFNKVKVAERAHSKVVAARETLQEKLQLARQTHAESMRDADMERFARRELEVIAERELEACAQKQEQFAHEEGFEAASSTSFSRKPMDKPQLQEEAESLLNRIQATRQAKRQVQATLESETAVWFHEVCALKGRLEVLDEEANHEERALQTLAEEHIQCNEQREELFNKVEDLSQSIKEVERHAEVEAAKQQRLERALAEAEAQLQTHINQRKEVRSLERQLSDKQEDVRKLGDELEDARDQLATRGGNRLFSCLLRPSRRQQPPASRAEPSRVPSGEDDLYDG